MSNDTVTLADLAGPKRSKVVPTAAPEVDDAVAVEAAPVETLNGMKIVTLTELDLVIERDAMTKIPKKAYAHELPALKFIHGEDRVEVVGRRNVKLANFDIHTELLRMRKRYDRKNFAVIAPVYGHDPVRRLSDLSGVEADADGKARAEVHSKQKIRDTSDQVRMA